MRPDDKPQFSARFTPVRNMLQPTIGMKKMLVLEINLKGRLMWKREKMSYKELSLISNALQKTSTLTPSKEKSAVGSSV